MQVLRETVWQVLKQPNIELLHDTAIPLLGDLETSTPETYTSVRSIILHESQKVETTKISTN